MLSETKKNKQKRMTGDRGFVRMTKIVNRLDVIENGVAIEDCRSISPILVSLLWPWNIAIHLNCLRDGYGKQFFAPEFMVCLAAASDASSSYLYPC